MIYRRLKPLKRLGGTVFNPVERNARSRLYEVKSSELYFPMESGPSMSAGHTLTAILKRR